MPALAHVATFRQRSQRQIIGRRGVQTTTLCGAGWTNQDITLASLRRMTGIEAAERHVCEACIQIAQRMEASR